MRKTVVWLLLVVFVFCAVARASSQEVVSTIKLISLTETVIQGGTARVEVEGVPDSEYSILVKYSTARSKAAGLEPKKSDENGIVHWTWKVGPKTKPGRWPIEVKKVDGSKSDLLTLSFLVIEAK